MMLAHMNPIGKWLMHQGIILFLGRGEYGVE
jgi:hypothetical protein